MKDRGADSSAHSSVFVKLECVHSNILLLCLLILVGPQINWKTKGTVRTRNTVSVISKRTIRVAKDWQSPNLTHTGFYRSNDTETCTDSCCAGANWKLVLLSNEISRSHHSWTYISL